MKQLLEEDKIIRSAKHIHMIGIGGSGMCPLAEILHHEGYEITGSDNNESDTLNRIRALGIPVAMGQRAENIHGVFNVVRPDKIRGRRILLVDDVMTTGATFGELRRVLVNAGATAVYGVTFCRVVRAI